MEKETEMRMSERREGADDEFRLQLINLLCVIGRVDGREWVTTWLLTVGGETLTRGSKAGFNDDEV